MNRKNIISELLSSLSRLSFKDLLFFSTEAVIRFTTVMLGVFLPSVIFSTTQGNSSMGDAFFLGFIFIICALLSFSLGDYMNERQKHLNLLVREEVVRRINALDTQDLEEDNVWNTIDVSGISSEKLSIYGRTIRRVFSFFYTTALYIILLIYIGVRTPFTALLIIIVSLMIRRIIRNAGDVRDSFDVGLKPLLERSAFFRELREDPAIQKDMRTSTLDKVILSRSKENREVAEAILSQMQKKGRMSESISELLSYSLMFLGGAVTFLAYEGTIYGRMNIFGLTGTVCALVYISLTLVDTMKTAIYWSKGARKINPTLELLSLRNRDEKAVLKVLKDSEDSSQKEEGYSFTKKDPTDRLFIPELKREKIERIEKIEFKDVSFIYPGKTKHILENACFTIKNPEKAMLTGYKGSGKSTLVYLLTGLFRPVTGTILINDIPMNDVDMVSYRDRISVLFQNSQLLPVSLKDNMTLGKDTDPERMNKVMTGLGIKEEELDMTMLDDVSSEEKERILLGRALMEDRDLIILDEPSKDTKKLLNRMRKVENGIRIIVTEKIRKSDYTDAIILCHQRMVYYFHSKDEFREIFPDIYKDLAEPEDMELQK